MNSGCYSFMSVRIIRSIFCTSSDDSWLSCSLWLINTIFVTLILWVCLIQIIFLFDTVFDFLFSLHRDCLPIAKVSRRGPRLTFDVELEIGRHLRDYLVIFSRQLARKSNYFGLFASSFFRTQFTLNLERIWDTVFGITQCLVSLNNTVGALNWLARSVTMLTAHHLVDCAYLSDLAREFFRRAFLWLGSL